jgi:hypothetical protein
VQEILPIILYQINDFESPPLTTHEDFHVAKPKARRPILVFNDDGRNTLIFEKCQKLRSIVIHPRANFFDDLLNLIAFRRAIVF